MDDLISRKALIETYCEENCGSRKCVDAMDRCVFISYVLGQPPVEAVPVVHGEWIDTCPDYHNGFRSNAHKCSICGDYYTTEPEELFFCPRCGADMRKKVQDGKID